MFLKLESGLSSEILIVLMTKELIPKQIELYPFVEKKLTIHLGVTSVQI